MITVALTKWTEKGFTRLFLITAVAFFWFLYDSYQPVRAEKESIIVDMPMHSLVGYEDFFRRAEARVFDEISDQFRQKPALSEIEVVVVGNRHGEIVPILSTTVSRTQWQKTPGVSLRTKYYNASYALLQRYEGSPPETVAKTPARTTRAAQSAIAEIDRAFDEGRLTGTMAQEYLNKLD